MPKVARVLFDEAHSRRGRSAPRWRPPIQPSHPADSSYAARRRGAAATRDFTVAAHIDGALDEAALRDADVLVIAHPSEPEWERIVPGGSPRFGDGELDAIEAFVAGGGGLIVLAEEEQAKYGNNVAELAARFGVTIDNALVSDYERHHKATPSWVLADLEPTAGRRTFSRASRRRVLLPGDDARGRGGGAGGARAPARRGVLGARRVARRHGPARRRAAWSCSATPTSSATTASTSSTTGRCGSTSSYWVAGGAFTDREGAGRLAGRGGPGVGEAQGGDRRGAAAAGARRVGRRGPEAPDGVAAHVDDDDRGRSRGCAGHFPHQADYLDAVVADLAAWRDGGLRSPTSRARSSCSGPSGSARTASSTSSSSRCTSRTRRATRASRR